MKARWKILIAIGIFLVLLAASMMFSAHFQPENEVEAYKKLLRDKGEKLEISEVLPPPVAPESNSLDAVEDALRLSGSSSGKIPNAMQMVAPGKAMAAWMQPDVRGYDGSGNNMTNSWDDFAADVATDHPAIELLHQVLERPKLDFQLDYKKGAELSLPHLSSLKRSAQKLEAVAVLDLHNGDMGAAATNILTMLGLVQRNASEGLLISHLVRIAMTSIAVAPTWELLQATNVTDAQLAAIQQGWEQLDFLSDATNAFAIERAWGIDIIQKMRASHEEFEKRLGGMASMSAISGSGGPTSGGGWSWPPDWEEITERPRYAVAEVMWRSSWSYSDELRTLQGDSIILETLRAMQTNQSQFYKADYDAMTARLSSLGITNAGEAFFHALKIPDFSDEFGGFAMGNVVQRIIRTETGCRIVVTAIALKRFQLKHGKLPETLGELMPELFPSVPIDPYDGKPLQYHPNADGSYLLYSIGDNGKDDGGDPTNTASGSSSFYWQHGRDWVWPQPATAAEAQFFYDHPPK
jgi:hypothetical protein